MRHLMQITAATPAIKQNLIQRKRLKRTSKSRARVANAFDNAMNLPKITRVEMPKKTRIAIVLGF